MKGSPAISAPVPVNVVARARVTGRMAASSFPGEIEDDSVLER